MCEMYLHIDCIYVYTKIDGDDEIFSVVSVFTLVRLETERASCHSTGAACTVYQRKSLAGRWGFLMLRQGRRLDMGLEPTLVDC